MMQISSISICHICIHFWAIYCLAYSRPHAYAQLQSSWWRLLLWRSRSLRLIARWWFRLSFQWGPRWSAIWGQQVAPKALSTVEFIEHASTLMVIVMVHKKWWYGNWHRTKVHTRGKPSVWICHRGKCIQSSRRRGVDYADRRSATPHRKFSRFFKIRALEILIFQKLIDWHFSR